MPQRYSYSTYCYNSPLYFVCPICSRHLPFGDVRSMTSFESFIALTTVWTTFNTSLSKPNELHLVTVLCQHSMTLCWMIWCCLWLVVATKLFTASFDCHINIVLYRAYHASLLRTSPSLQHLKGSSSLCASLKRL